MRTLTLLTSALFVAMASTSCGRAEDAEADTASGRQASEPREAAATPKRSDRRKPEAKQAPDATRAQDTVASQAAPEPKAPLRFDMTQDGKAQTAEHFEAWMDEQGVRVAEGADAGEAPAPAREGAAAGTGIEAGAGATRR